MFDKFLYICIMHCISIYLLKKEDIRDEKISTIIDNKTSEIKFTEMGGGILATTYIPNIKEFGANKTIAKISTDYFGGSGSQDAKLFIDNKKVYDKSDEIDYSVNPINDVLALMGIKKVIGHRDEFEVVDKYRSNEDFN